MARRMLSIASAPGWCARFETEEPYEEERTVMLVSWALVEEDDATTSIVGVVQRQATEGSPAGQLGLADEVAGFQGYTFTGLATKEFPTLQAAAELTGHLGSAGANQDLQEMLRRIVHSVLAAPSRARYFARARRARRPGYVDLRRPA